MFEKSSYFYACYWSITPRSLTMFAYAPTKRVQFVDLGFPTSGLFVATSFHRTCGLLFCGLWNGTVRLLCVIVCNGLCAPGRRYAYPKLQPIGSPAGTDVFRSCGVRLAFMELRPSWSCRINWIPGTTHSGDKFKRSVGSRSKPYSSWKITPSLKMHIGRSG